MSHFNIVIIEDSEVELGLLSHVVENVHNVKLFSFMNGADAENFLRTAHPFSINMILCDWQLPKFNGLELLQTFRTVYKNAPFFYGNQSYFSVFGSTS
jgi:CheY-like chemotaxis protein